MSASEAPSAQRDASDAPGTLAHPLGGLASTLRVLLLVAAVLSAGLAYLAVRMRVELDDVDRTDGFVGNAANDAVDAFFNGVAVYFTTLVGIGAVFIIWLYRAAQNNRDFGRPGSLGPVWAIVSWFIPIGSLVLPGVLVHHLWKGADGSVPRGDPGWHRVRSSVQAWSWWIAYVLGQMATFLGFTLIGGTDRSDSELTAVDLVERIEDVRGGVTLFVAGQALLIAAAALGVATIIGLTRRQEATATALGPALPGAVPQGFGRPSPAAWHPDPTGRFDQRFWDGRLWTDHVMRGDEQTEDPEPL